MTFRPALLSCLFLTAAPATALGQDAATQPAVEATTTTTAAPTQAATAAEEVDVDQPYDALVVDGLSRLVQRDAAGAERLLRAAIDKDSGRPEAYCHLGDAQRLAGNLDEAVRSYQSCTRFALGLEDDRYARIGRCNEGLTLERIEGRREQARAVYETLKSTEDPAASEAWTLASERLKALAAYGLLETVYGPVRVRIHERAEKNAAKERAK